MKKHLHVVVGLLINAAGQILISKRKPGANYQGYWEFPGGKLEGDEQPMAALNRELHEELGITIDQAKPFLTLSYTYPEYTVFLDVWRVESWNGLVYGKENQELRWVPTQDLTQYNFLAANRAIINAFKLPRCYLITPEPEPNFGLFLKRLERCIATHDLRLVQLRVKTLKYKDFRLLCAEVWELCHAKGVTLIANYENLAEIDQLHGVHVSAQQLMSLSSRVVPQEKIFGASCHNLAEIAKANELGADYISLSSVFPTSSHPGVGSLGWGKFSQLASQANMPVYALGGLKIADKADSRRHHAFGIAMISGLWGS